MGKIVGMTQSSYIPWKGFFDYINSVDAFYFYDDAQFTKQDWRSRNRIKSPKAEGWEWLTVPVGKKTRNRRICDVEITQNDWQKSHWGKIRQYYKDAPYFQEYKAFFEEIYMGHTWTNLSEMNQTITKRIAVELLDIPASKFAGDSRDYHLDDTKKKEDRYIPMLKEVGCTTYISGPSAKSYLTEERMAKEGIELKWMNYEGYPEYEQLYPPFRHDVTVLDLLFHVGKEYKRYMLSYS